MMVHRPFLLPALAAMQVVYTHYHLNLCGVTQVVLNQLGALAALPASERPTRVGILYGGRREGWPSKLWKPGNDPPFEVVLIPLPSIDYDVLPEPHAVELATEVLAVLADNGFGPDDTIVHAHNHSLGKNVSWPGALTELARKGYRLLLQIHDFAEDFRPENYRRLSRALAADQAAKLPAQLYPQAGGILYGTLTERDDKLLASAGIVDQRRCVLPNPVAEFSGLKEHSETAQPIREALGLPTDARLVLYPVRGIRRKNLGELLLYSALSPANTWHAITLGPKNPVEIPAFTRWKDLAEELDLRCLFDICGEGGTEFLDTLAASDAIITTSIAEGFGMVFLEAWLADKPLVGRNLPEITHGFEQAGLVFEGLRDTLRIPLAWLSMRADLPEALRISYEWVCDRYDTPPAPAEQTKETIQELAENDAMDFALLPSRFQESVIRYVANNPDEAREELVKLNPGIESILQGATQLEQTVGANAKAVRSAYSLSTIGKQLRDVYNGLLSASPSKEITAPKSGEALLEQFLRLDRLHAIRIEE